MDKISIFEMAKRLINDYGANASMYATEKAAAMLAQGDVRGYYEWMQLGRAIEKMQPLASRQ